MIRDLENLSKKASRHRNHQTFTHRYKDLGLTPVSLKLKCPIRTNKAQAIINKAQKDLLRERIRVTSNKIASLDSQIKVVNNDLETLSLDVRRAVSAHVNNAKETEFKKCKARQIEKLTRLKSKNVSKLSTAEPLDLSGTQLKKWVTNISQRKLSQPEVSLLQKGSQFCCQL